MKDAATGNGKGVTKVGVRQFRDGLSQYLQRVQDGDVFVVTDRGRAIARVVPINGDDVMERLIAEGLVTPASSPKRLASAGSQS